MACGMPITCFSVWENELQGLCVSSGWTVLLHHDHPMTLDVPIPVEERGPVVFRTTRSHGLEMTCVLS
jgi:hypothetical protein